MAISPRLTSRPSLACRALIVALLLGAGLGVITGAPAAEAALSDGFDQIDVGFSHTCGISTVDELFCWGTGNEGQLGNGTGGPLTQAVPLLIPPPATKTWASVTTGGYHTCALVSTGEAYCWGVDQWGQLGNGPALADPVQPAPSPVAAPVGVTWAQLSAGARHTCGISTVGSAYCWGADDKGQLGNGATTGDQSSPTLVPAPGGASWSKIHAAGPDTNNFGGQQTCAVTTAGAGFCWGDDSEGQLGNGATTGDQASPSPVSTPGGVIWSKITTGLKHTCGVSTTGAGYCWGAGQSVQLGIGLPAPSSVTTPTAVVTPVGAAWAEISPGSFMTCGRTTAGVGYCWGTEGGAGELGNGPAVTAQQAEPFAITVPAAVAGWTAITAGNAHACAIATDADAWCWGSDTTGKLGNGTAITGNQPAPTLVSDGGVVVTPPSAPTVVAATAGDAQVALTWTAPTSTGGSAITGYEVTPYIGAAAQAPITFNSTALSQTVTGLVNGTTYTFTVAGKNAAGAGAPSGPSAAVTPTGAAVAPGAPTGVSGTPGNAQVVLSWTAPTSAGTQPIDGYVVTPYIGASAQTATTFNSTATIRTVAGLVNGTAYTFRVAARSTVGTGAQSAPTAAITPRTVPSPPLSVAAVAGPNQAVVSWSTPNSNGGSAITGYTVIPAIGGVAQTPIVYNASATSRTITGLTNGTTYTFTVVARNVAGSSSASGPSVPVTPQPTPAVPGAPTGLGGFASTGQVTLSWTAPASSGTQPIIDYIVTPSIGASAQAPIAFDASSTTHSVTGLTNGTAYTFRVAARNAVGTGLQSAASPSLTPFTTPGTPTAVTAIAGNAQAVVSWTAPGFNGGLPLTGYVVTPYLGAAAQTSTTFNSTAVSQTVTGLTNGSAYTFRVAAKNQAGTGAQSAASGAVTPVAPADPFAPFASWSAFVERQFIDLTTVAPTAAQRTAWVADLTSGAKTKGDLIETLRRGTDNTVAADPAARLYRAFLQRTPDAGGLRFWVTRRRTGTWTLVRIADSFAGSSEFIRKYGTLTNRAFVTRIYTDVLERNPDQAGIDYWTRQLDLRRRNRGSVMVGFSESGEYKRKQAELTDVAVAYIYLLGRAPNTSEVTAWVTRQQAGTSQATLATELLDSAAYAARIGG